MKTSPSTLNQAAALIDSCSNFVAQLDAHKVGGAMFVCCLALVLVGVVVVALAVALHAARQSEREEPPKARKKAQRAPAAVGNSQQPGR